MTRTAVVKAFEPPSGTNFRCLPFVPIATLSRDLCKVAAFVQNFAPYAKLVRYDDWWEHDGLHFERGVIDMHGLFNRVGTPRSLLQAVPGDWHVFVGVAPQDRSWYLRFFVDWDENDESLIGTFDVTFRDATAIRFRVDVAPTLECSITEEESHKYYASIGCPNVPKQAISQGDI